MAVHDWLCTVIILRWLKALITHSPSILSLSVTLSIRVDFQHGDIVFRPLVQISLSCLHVPLINLLRV